MRKHYLLLLILLRSLLVKGSCEPYEYTDKNGVLCKWNIAADNEYQASRPLCITTSGKLMIRQCLNDEWIPSGDDECEAVTELYQSQYFETGLVLLKYSTDPEPFNLKDIRFSHRYDGFQPFTWYPCRRNSENKLLVPYLCVHTTMITILDDFLSEEDCIVSSDSSIGNGGKNIQGFSCSGEHYSVVADILLEMNNLCLGMSLNYHQNECYTKDNGPHVSIKEFASLQNIFMRSIENSYINGARISESTTFENVDVVIDYLSPTLFTLQRTDNALPPGSNPESENEPKNILTKNRLQERNIVMKLSDTHNGAYIEVMIENYTFLQKFEEPNFGIACFNDANYLTLVNVEQVNVMDDMHFFRVHLDSVQGLANYWCAGYSIFGFEMVETERILTGYLYQSFDQYAFYLTFGIDENSNINMLTDSVKSSLEFAGLQTENVKIFEILKSPGKDSTGDVLFHIVVDIDLPTVHKILTDSFGFAYHQTVNSTTVCYEAPLNASIIDVVWPTTPINSTTELNSTKYLTNEYKPATRKCIGSFPYGAVWEEFDSADMVFNLGGGLSDLLGKIPRAKPVDVVDELEDLVSMNNKTLTPKDYEKIQQVVESVDVDKVEPGEEDSVIGNVTSLVNILLETEPCTACKNSTNNIAASVERIIDSLIIRPDVTTSEVGVSEFIEKDFYVFGIDVSKANINGLILYEDQYNYSFIYRNSSNILKLLPPEAQIASCIPSHLIDHWNATGKYRSKFVMKVYKNDNLFQERKQRSHQKLEYNITSISVPLYDDDLEGFTVPLILQFKGLNPLCYYWNFKRRSWKTNGVTTDVFPDNKVVCNLTHMTPFTHLIDIVDSQDDIFWLDSITMVFSSLSLIGTLGIFFTASVLKKWRKTKSTRILLQLTSASILQISLFLAISALNFENNFVFCFILGVLLQYSLLVEFLWMMVIAISNWMFYKYPFRQGLASFCYLSAFCWCIPILPVSFTTGFGLVESFHNHFDYNLCFPHTTVKLWGFVVPLFLIMSVNVVFYGLLIYEFVNIWKNEDLFVNEKKSQLKQMVRNTTIFFFTLGLPWIFGLLHIILSGSHYPNVFSYIFVLTAPLQGFILFVYFVLINPTVHEEWESMVEGSRLKREEDWATKDKAINFWVRCWTCKEE